MHKSKGNQASGREGELGVEIFPRLLQWVWEGARLRVTIQDVYLTARLDGDVIVIDRGWGASEREQRVHFGACSACPRSYNINNIIDHL